MSRAVRGAIGEVARPLLRLHWVGWLGFGAAAALAALGLTAWALRAGGSPVLPLVVWPLVLLALGCTVLLAAARATRWRVGGMARQLEQTGRWRSGALQGLLAPVAPGTSNQLLEHADATLADEVTTGGPEALSALHEALGSRARWALALLLGALLLLFAASPLEGPARALWAPAGALEALRAPIELTVGSGVLDQGGTAVFGVRAPGVDEAILHLRAPGEAWREEHITLDADGIGRFATGPLDADLFAFATRGTRSTDTLTVTVRLPAFVGSVEVTAHYPAYLRMEREPLPVGGDTIALPAGTVLETSGLATLPLAEAAWVGARGRHRLDVDGSRFAGRLTPSGTDRMVLVLRTASGAPLAGDTAVLRLRLVPDGVPQVSIPVPGADTIAPATLQVPLVLDASDDHGLVSVRLVSRRVSRLGLASDPVATEVQLPPGQPDRAVLSPILDASDRGLLPGDTLRYWAEVVDNTPGGQEGRSVEYALRIPTLAELRDVAREAGTTLGQQLDSLARRSADLERRTEDLARSRARSEQGAARNAPLDYQEAQRAQAVAQEQAELLEQAEALSEALEQLERAAEAGGMSDPEWQQRIRELQEQLERALSPELREQLAALQQALEQLDAERTREALENLAERQRQLREALERSRELFRRAALEGDLNRLEAEARELAREMESWAERARAADSLAARAQADRLAGRADSLGAAVERAGEEAATENAQRGTELGETAEQARRAGERMAEAGAAMQQGNRQQAQQSGQQAAAEMEPLGDALEEARRQMAEQWQEEVASSLDRTIAETARLTERQVDIERRLGAGEAGAGLRAEQGAVEEGVRQLLEQVARAAGSNALVSNRIGVALERSRREMAAAREALTQATPDARRARQATGQAAELLTLAAYEMLKSRDDISNAESGSGLEEAMQQMSQLAQQQGQLSQQAAGMLPMPGPGMQGELQRVAGQQRALAEALERMQAAGEVPGAGEFAAEAEELARRLEAGLLDRATVERQERLFRKMLDAGRTLQGEERDEKKERQSTSAEGIDPRLPASARIGTGQPRMPSWEELQQLSPEERRLVVDYFRRLGEGTR